MYYNAASNYDWNTLTNWWTDSNFTSQASSLPTVSDDVVISQSVSSNSGPAISVNTLSLNGTSDISSITVTVANGATLNNSSAFYNSTIVGDATFFDNSFNSTSAIVTGNAVFNDSSYNRVNATVSGNGTFNDITANNGTVSGNACFATTATNTGTVLGSISVCSISIPTVITTTYLETNTTSVDFQGEINITGGSAVTTIGFQYGLTDSYGSIASQAGTYYSESFSISASPFVCGTTYNYRAFATNSAGTGYGNNLTFSTQCITSTLYGVDGVAGTVGAPNLYTINPDTGDTTLIGAVGYYITGLVFSPLTGTLYGVSGNSGNNPNGLFTINTSTGAGTYLGIIKNGGGTIVKFGDISFRSNEALYGEANDGNLYTVDLNSCNGTSDTDCLVTKIGNVNLSVYGNGLAFDSNDNLYMFGDADDTYWKLNPDTGAVISNPSFSNSSGQGYVIGAATFNENDLLFAPRVNYGNPPSDLIRINLVTNTITSMGENADMQYISALAFYILSENLVPVLTSISPTSAILNDGDTTITATGTDFISSSVVKWNGTSLATTYISSTELTAIVPSSNLLVAGTATVTVTNPAPGGGTSNTITFTINATPVSSSGSRPKTTRTVIPPTTTETICPLGHLFSTTTGLPCTSFFSSSTPTIPPMACLITLTLRQGNQGEQVKCLQTKLNQNESLNLSLDGIFGPITKSAVMNFQRLHNLVVDGIVGPMTRGVMGM